MQELIISKSKDEKTICLVEDGKLIERYKEYETAPERIEKNIYIGKVENVLYGMQAAFINIGKEKNGLIHFEDVLPKLDITTNETLDELEVKRIIKEKLLKGNKILVQVKKDGNEIKGARLTTHIKLVGKYLVLMPDTSIVTISQKITNAEEKERLKNMMSQMLPNKMGAIIRTSCMNKKEEEIEQDLNDLIQRWENIQKEFQDNTKYPMLLEENNNIVNKMILDIIEQNIENIYVNNVEDYNQIINYLKSINSYEKVQVILKENEDLLEKYELKKQLEKSYNRKVWLNCGGFIVIDKTEALTAIDVNSGKYTGNKNLEETVLKVNKEATKEIAKQIRLRDIAGIIIIDYIDMKEAESKEIIKKLLNEELKKDRSKTQVIDFTKLNLFELTRKHIFSNNYEKREEK